MAILLSRRGLLGLVGASLWADAALSGDRATPAAAALGTPEPFSFDRLIKTAEALAASRYEARAVPAPEILDKIDYAQHGEIVQARASRLYASGPGEAEVSFFHLAKLFRKPVRMYALDHGIAREVLYHKSDFTYPRGNPAADMPDDVGFAGFRIHTPRSEEASSRSTGEVGDWVAFLGASYLRSAGDGRQYGLSARGIAIDSACAQAPFNEDFPDFISFYIEPFRDGQITVYALMDGASCTGAYRFVITRRPSIVMEVEANVILRRDATRFGMAPLTSMFFYDQKKNRWAGDEWRPQVHDSDGLAMQNGRGEWLWRPLNNPPRVMVSSFLDAAPRGFGLVQRDRKFDSYLDDVGFEKRPNGWVEPLGDWGRGAVQLLELPTSVEYEDNIGAFWVPEAPATAGSRHHFAYRLHWSIVAPEPASVAICTATRMGKGYAIKDETTPPGATERLHDFQVEFDGKDLEGLDPDEAEPIVSASRGRIVGLGLRRRSDGLKRVWRVYFGIGAEGDKPIELRLYVKQGKRVLTETWLYQLHPMQWVS